MCATKASGPDGMIGAFYQHYCSVVKSHLKAMVKDFFWSSFLLRQLNHTFIALISKRDNPTKIVQFCPISLCYVAYKLILKILGNRLGHVMARIVSHPQAVFIPRRIIFENTIMAQEVFHTMKHKSGRSGVMATKLDMARAYYIMECGFGWWSNVFQHPPFWC